MADFRGWAARQHAPFTVFLAAALVATSVLGLVVGGASVRALALTDPSIRPWGFLTYPFAISPLDSGFGILFLVFLVVWLLNYGGAVERDLSTPRFALFWVVFTILAALVALGLGTGLAGPWLPTTAVVVAWCGRNRTAPICFWGISISATVLACVMAGMVVFEHGLGRPMAGVLLALPLTLAWAFGSGLLPVAYSGATARRRGKTVTRGGAKYDETYFEDVKKREIEREERERLRKLFEGK